MPNRIIDKLLAETRDLLTEADVESRMLLGEISVDRYREFLARLYGFVLPLEKSLMHVQGLQRVYDLRRLRKHELIARDLEGLGLRPRDVELLPQCGAVPFFDNVPQALGWAFIIERSTLAHPNLFRQLAMVMPGDVAFSAAYLKCYFGAVGEMWQSFIDGLEQAVYEPNHTGLIVSSAQAGLRHQRRWLRRLDGKSTTSMTLPRLQIA